MGLALVVLGTGVGVGDCEELLEVRHSGPFGMPPASRQIRQSHSSQTSSCVRLSNHWQFTMSWPGGHGSEGVGVGVELDEVLGSGVGVGVGLGVLLGSGAGVGVGL